MKRIIEKLSLLTLKDIILSVVISLILVSIGTTFAYFSWQSTNNPLVNITVEDMADVKFSGGNDLKATDIGPVLDYNDGEIIDFSVRKKIDAPIYALILKYYLMNLKFHILKVNYCLVLTMQRGVN